MTTDKCYCPGHIGYTCMKDGWHYVHIEGAPSERGYQHGYLLAQYIADSIGEVSRLVYVQTGMDWDFFCQKAHELWADKLGEEYTAELSGIVEGVKAGCGADISFDALLAWNGYEELTDYWFPTVAKDIYSAMGSSGAFCGKNFNQGADDRCSAFIATGSYTADGNVVVAHNSFSPFEVGSYVNVILDVVPDTGHPFIMQAQPGFIHSFTDFYVSNRRFIITETTIGGFNAYDPSGVPEFVRIRRAAQYAESLDDITAILLEGNNGGYANTWLAGDIETREIMRLELGLKFHKVDKTTDGAFAGFNAPLDPRIRNFECSNSGFADVRRHQGARQVRIPQLLEEYKGRLDTETGKRILADHYDPYLHLDGHPSSRTVCAHYELDDRSSMSQPGRPVPFCPRGAVDGVVSSAAEARQGKLWGRFCSSCGMGFDAAAFLREHPQFDYLKDFLKDRPSQGWALFE